MSQTPNLQLPFLDANQNQKHVTHNAALSVLDVLVNCGVVSTSLTAPPGNPGDGQCWLVGAGATGAWAGKDRQVAAWQDGAWSFFVPKPGTTVYAADRATLLAWSGTGWAPAVPGPSPQAGNANAFLQALIFG